MGCSVPDASTMECALSATGPKMTLASMSQKTQRSCRLFLPSGGCVGE